MKYNLRADLRSWQYVNYFPLDLKDKAFQQVLASLKLQGGNLGIQLSPNLSGRFPPTSKEFIYGGISFMFIREGSFIAGGIDEKSGDELLIPYDYCIGRDPVTNEQYAIYAVEKGLGFFYAKGKNNHPVGGITWKAAMDFVNWFKERHNAEIPDNYVVDLPSTEEWEKAARGVDGRIYPWGRKFDINMCNTKENNIGETTPVGKYSPMGDSTFGMRDMAGNVWEWTRSSMGNIPNSLARIMRGGSYGDKSIYAACTFSMEYPIATSADSFGFRLAIVPKSKYLLDEVYFPTL